MGGGMDVRSPTPPPRLDEGVVAVRGHDHVVARHDPDQLGGGAQALGEVRVLGTGCGVAGYALLRISGVMRTTALCGPPSGIARQRAIRAVRGRHNRDATAAEVRS